MVCRCGLGHRSQKLRQQRILQHAKVNATSGTWRYSWPWDGGTPLLPQASRVTGLRCRTPSGRSTVPTPPTFFAGQMHGKSICMEDFFAMLSTFYTNYKQSSTDICRMGHLWLLLSGFSGRLRWKFHGSFRAEFCGPMDVVVDGFLQNCWDHDKCFPGSIWMDFWTPIRRREAPFTRNS